MSVDPYAAAREIKDTLVMHTEFQRALDGADEIVDRSVKLGVPLGLTITAAPGMGKTILLKLIAQKVRQRFASMNNDDPVVGLEFDAMVDLHKVAGWCLEAVHYPTSPGRANLVAMTGMIDAALERLNPRLGTIDEAQHVCEGCRDITARAVTDWLKRRMDIHGLTLVLAGTEVVARLRDINPQFASRVSAEFAIQTFPFGPSWHQVLGGFAERVKAVDLGILRDRKVARGLFDGAVGNLRRLKQWLGASTYRTLLEQRRELALGDLDRGFVGAFGPKSIVVNPFEGMS